MRTFICWGLLIGCLSAPAVALSDAASDVRIDNFKFGPTDLTIDKGTTVNWTNQDDIPHSIVITAAGVHSKVLDTDQAFTYQFTKIGTYAYVCGLHPFMHGQVVVR